MIVNIRAQREGFAVPADRPDRRFDLVFVDYRVCWWGVPGADISLPDGCFRQGLRKITWRSGPESGIRNPVSSGWFPPAGA